MVFELPGLGGSGCDDLEVDDGAAIVLIPPLRTCGFVLSRHGRAAPAIGRYENSAALPSTPKHQADATGAGE